MLVTLGIWVRVWARTENNETQNHSMNAKQFEVYFGCPKI